MFSVTLNSGREIELVGLHVERTYEGWLDGAPDNEWNNGILAGVPERARKIFGSDLPFYIVEPIRRSQDDLADLGVIPEYLPGYWFVGKFCSKPVDSPWSETYPANRSWLVISWFQNDADSIPTTATTESLSTVPWETVAADIDAWE